MKHVLKLFILAFLIQLGCNRFDDESNFELIWSYDYTKPAEALSLAGTPPQLVGDHLILAPDEQITSINIEDGVPQWSLEFMNDAYIYNSEFMVSGNSMFIKERENQKLYSISLNNGQIFWEERYDGGFSFNANDVIDENFIYLSADNNKIVRYTQNGNIDKEYDLDIFGVLSRARSLRSSGLQLIFSQSWKGNVGCTVQTCGRVMSIDKESGLLLWSYETENGGFLKSFRLEDDIIYAGVTDGPGEFVALNANTGDVIWKTLGVIGQSYTLTDSMVLVNGGVSLRALDKFTGEELWNTGLAFGGGFGGDNIAYLNGYVYHAHSGRLYILEASTGEIVHVEERSPDGSPFQLLTVSEDKVFIQTFNALYAYTAWE